MTISIFVSLILVCAAVVTAHSIREWVRVQKETGNGFFLGLGLDLAPTINRAMAARGHKAVLLLEQELEAKKPEVAGFLPPANYAAANEQRRKQSDKIVRLYNYRCRQALTSANGADDPAVQQDMKAITGDTFVRNGVRQLAHHHMVEEGFVDPEVLNTEDAEYMAGALRRTYGLSR